MLTFLTLPLDHLPHHYHTSTNVSLKNSLLEMSYNFNKNIVSNDL